MHICILLKDRFSIFYFVPSYPPITSNGGTILKINPPQLNNFIIRLPIDYLTSS